MYCYWGLTKTEYVVTGVEGANLQIEKNSINNTHNYKHSAEESSNKQLLGTLRSHQITRNTKILIYKKKSSVYVWCRSKECKQSKEVYLVLKSSHIFRCKACWS